jgi:4-hydroxy-3-polyprenylbenzoate decarboxylase
MIQDKTTLAFYASPGKHATIMREKYWAMGKPCPVAMCFGQDPILFAISTMSLPWGLSEYEMAGYIKGKGVEVMIDPGTDLPIPASAEIVACGFSPPPEVDSRPEGPFGEWQGYYASGTRNEPVVHIETLYHRNNPILFGQPPVKPPVNTWFPIPIHTATFLWNQLEKAGMMDIKGVYVHGPGNRIIAVISLKQRYLGHAKQVATLAGAFLQGGACTGRYIITVDEDIDPSNLDEVLWAVCTRCDPEKYIDIVPGFLTSPLDPMISPDKRARKDYTTAKVFINACKPYHWKDQFPPINVAEPELRKKVLSKWANLFKEV